jgi:hypothetical protein
MSSQKFFRSFFSFHSSASSSSRFYTFSRNSFYSGHQSRRTSSGFSQAHLRHLPFVLFFAPISLKVFYLHQMSRNVPECAEAPRQDRIRGTYENKIRFFSPPEKIYETFASVKNEDGKLVMSYSDFFRALTPYNYTEFKSNKEYFEKYNPDILKVADVNGDGVISFPEFFFFITILQLPDSLLHHEFAKFDPINLKLSKS